MDVINNVVMKR